LGGKTLVEFMGLFVQLGGTAGLTGGATGALIRDLTGSYLYSFYLAAVLSLFAIAIATLGERQKHDSQTDS
jgi:hypothetical protein